MNRASFDLTDRLVSQADNDRLSHGTRKQSLFIAISVALSVVATTLILPILAPLLRELRFSAAQGGLMLSIGSVVMVVFAPLWGRLSDRRGRKAVILLGFMGVLLGYGVYTATVLAGLAGSLSITTSFVLLTLSRALTGVFLPAVPAGAQALMGDITTRQDRARGMAVISAATGIGLVIGPAVSGLLVPHGITRPLFAAMALCLLGALTTTFFLRPPAAVTPSQASTPRLTSAAFRPWLLAGIVTWIAIATVQISAGFYFQDTLGLDTDRAARMLSVALTLVGAAMLGAQVLHVRILHFSPRALVLAGAGFWVAGLLILLATASALPYYLAYALFGLGAGFLLPGVMAGASLAAGLESQGIAAGLVSASQGLGFIIGPVVSTMLYEWNRALPFWGLAGVMLLLAVKFVAIQPHRVAANDG